MINTILINTIFQKRYQVREILSEKTGRITLLAIDLETQELVILKLLIFNNQFIWDDLKLFEREAKTLKVLKHSAIPKYLDYFEFDLPDLKGFALVQTYIKAPNLEQCFQDGRRFTEDELKEIANKLLSILTYLHKQNPPIIHRDIKPSNILLTNRSGNSIGDIYLVDFGSVQMIAKQDGGTITIVGTYGYISPEQYMGKAVPASDLYSLGMTLIYLATGIQPADFIDDNGQIKLKDIQLSKQFKKWLEKTTQPYLNRRFPSAQMAQTALNSDDANMLHYAEIKPKNTKVQLHYDGEEINVVLAQYKDRCSVCIGLLIFSLLVVLFPSVLVGGVLIHISSFGNILISYVWVWLVLGFFCFVYIITQGLSIANIIINKKEIKAYNELGIKKLTNPRSEISLLAYSPRYQFNKYTDSTGEVKRGYARTEAELFIYAGSNKYSIAGLTDAEYLWLGKELSEFLDLELQIIYPTPKVRPESESNCGGC